MPTGQRRAVTHFLNKHPEVATSQNVTLLKNKLKPELARRNRLEDLHALVRELKIAIPHEDISSQAELFTWLMELNGLVRKMVLIKERQIEAGVMIKKEGTNKTYRVRSIGKDYSLSVEGLGTGLHPMFFERV